MSASRDALGYLWVGTQDGAARWNGREWLTIDMPDREVSNYVRSLAAARRSLQARVTRAIPSARLGWEYRIVANGFSLTLPRSAQVSRRGL